MEGLFVEIFSQISDPRVNRTRKHLFLDIIGLALFSVLAGAQNYTEIEDFCCHHIDWLKSYFKLPNGVPSHDTFSRVFSAINPSAFQDCFLTWLKAIVELFPEQVIAIDGKSIRASRRVRSDLKALHVVSAWSCANGLSLGQLIVDDKTNEITVIPSLLQTLCIKGAIVTIDAMGCQKAIAEQIIAQEGEYLLRVKANQGTLHDALAAAFEQARASQYQAMVYYSANDQSNNDHGRIESRQCIVLPFMYLMHMKLKWRGLKSLVLIISERETPEEEKTTEYRYYISSLDPKEPLKIMNSIRDHWQIENNLHWCLDVAFREDQSRIRDENSALNMSWLRKIALALLKRANIKGSIRRKQLAIWAKPQHLLDIVKI